MLQAREQCFGVMDILLNDKNPYIRERVMELVTKEKWTVEKAEIDKEIYETSELGEDGEEGLQQAEEGGAHAHTAHAHTTTRDRRGRNHMGRRVI